MECPEPVDKKSGQSNNFWLSYGPLKYVYKWSKISFSWITPKILTFEYYAKNQTYSEVNFICVYQVWSKLIEKCPSKIQDGRNKFSFFVISTSDRGDFLSIIEIALFNHHFIEWLTIKLCDFHFHSLCQLLSYFTTILLAWQNLFCTN